MLNIGISNNRCMAEIGSPKNGWHNCGRKAVVRSHREIFVAGRGSSSITLEYCKWHSQKAYKTESSIIRVVNVTPIAGVKHEEELA